MNANLGTYTFKELHSIFAGACAWEYFDDRFPRIRYSGKTVRQKFEDMEEADYLAVFVN